MASAVLAKSDTLMLAGILPALVVLGIRGWAMALDVDGTRTALQGTALPSLKVALAVLSHGALEGLSDGQHGGNNDEECGELHF